MIDPGFKLTNACLQVHGRTQLGCHVGCQIVRQHVTCMPPPSTDKAAHSGFETRRRCHQKSETAVSAAPKRDLCPPNFVLKNRNWWRPILQQHCFCRFKHSMQTTLTVWYYIALKSCIHSFISPGGQSGFALPSLMEEKLPPNMYAVEGGRRDYITSVLLLKVTSEKRNFLQVELVLWITGGIHNNDQFHKNSA